MGMSLFVTIAAMTVIVAITAGLFARGRSVRVLLAGLGLALIPLAMFLTGMTTLLVNGIGSLISWAQRTGWTDSMTWGISLGGLAIALLVGAGLLPKRERTTQPKTKQDKQQPATPDPKPTPSIPAAPQAARPQPAAKPQAKAVEPIDEELDEIEAILKKRGIV